MSKSDTPITSNRVVFIIPFFGSFPDYFQLFLNSCSFNPNFDWLIFSDNTKPYSYPDNVHFVKMTFEECHKLVQSKFNFPIVLHKPQKLCDYKCAYGYIFADYIKSYNWWGHCDLDQIFGHLGNFITDDMLAEYDKIGSIGHLTLYRNTHDNNIVFMSTERYKQVFTTETGCGFDEWLPDNINDIYINSNKNIFLENKGADIHSYHTSFRTVNYNIANRCYVETPVKNSVFLFDNGVLTQLYIENHKTVSVEYPYIHLQKRTMADCRKDKSKNRFFIVPNKFTDTDIPLQHLLAKAKLRGIFNTQFVKVKYKSFKYRLNSGDWNFSSVFK